MLGDCKICAESARTDHKHFSRCAGGQPTKLFGGFYADLCSDCLNRWAEVIRGSASLKEYLELQIGGASIEVEIHAGPRSDENVVRLKAAVEANNRKRIAVELIAYEFAKAWVASEKARVKAEVPVSAEK